MLRFRALTATAVPATVNVQRTGGLGHGITLDAAVCAPQQPVDTWTVTDDEESSIYMASGAETPSRPRAAASVRCDATLRARRNARSFESSSFRTGESR